MTWYDAASGVNLTSKLWQSRVNASNYATLGGTAPTFATDARDSSGAAGNNLCPVTYLSGVQTSTISFPDSYSSGTAFTVCTVSRYPTANVQARIFQDATANCVRPIAAMSWRGD